MTIFQNRLVITKQQQQQVLQKLHNAHQGIQRCSLQASFIKQCYECQKSSVLPREPLITATLLLHPLHQTYFT